MLPHVKRQHVSSILSERKRPSIPPERAALAERMRALCETIGTQARVHELTGVSERQIRQYVSGRSVPPLPIVAKLASLARADAHWVLTGEGTLAGRAPTAVTDHELLGRIVDAIARVYREERAVLPDVDLGRVAAEQYDDIVAAYPEPEARLNAVRLIAEQLRRRLRTEDPRSRKRGA